MGKHFVRKSLEAAIYKRCNVRGVFLQYVKNTRFDGAIHFSCIESSKREQEFCFSVQRNSITVYFSTLCEFPGISCSLRVDQARARVHLGRRKS